MLTIKDYLRLEDELLNEKIIHAKKQLGSKLSILGHHYQKDEIIEFCDEIGDSLQLAQIAQKNRTAAYIVFCGVHFMAETADMLTSNSQKVLLPNKKAGCSMADMADLEQLEICWEQLVETFGDDFFPITYVNSTAEVKAFVGRHNGFTVTSGNADELVQKAIETGKRILFLPDQHLGRNTVMKLGIEEREIALYNPLTKEILSNEIEEDIRVVLWDGHCCVHQKFTPDMIHSLREEHDDIQVIVHPECPEEIVNLSDASGSTNKILSVINASAEGSKWAVGTDNNMVSRLIKEQTNREVISLNPKAPPCRFMNLITKGHLAYTLESLVEGRVINEIKVREEIKQDALLAIERMLAI
ncbi:MAG: quinolinate synthase NadA [Streptococcaceae bacterium]|jgi:quinolinate synthase|nr:quinolinate synthase NadA [Streptococcaceae bacterium]